MVRLKYVSHLIEKTEIIWWPRYKRTWKQANEQTPTTPAAGRRAPPEIRGQCLAANAPDASITFLPLPADAEVAHTNHLRTSRRSTQSPMSI
jgi:hypothetical protein